MLSSQITAIPLRASIRSARSSLNVLTADIESSSSRRLQTARDGCNLQYPMRVGNYLPHAHCVNAAIETYALPNARYPDLIRLQAQVRASLSEKIDRRRITVQAGERRMAEADPARRSD